MSRSRQRRRSTRPPPAPPACAPLYCSLLRCCSLQGEQASGGGHYTPPPMLCPLRAGTGLYCNLASRGQQRAQTLRLQNAYGESERPVTCRPSTAPCDWST